MKETALPSRKGIVQRPQQGKLWPSKMTWGEKYTKYVDVCIFLFRLRAGDWKTGNPFDLSTFIYRCIIQKNCTIQHTIRSSMETTRKLPTMVRCAASCSEPVRQNLHHVTFLCLGIVLTAPSPLGRPLVLLLLTGWTCSAPLNLRVLTSQALLDEMSSCPE